VKNSLILLLVFLLGLFIGYIIGVIQIIVVNFY